MGKSERESESDKKLVYVSILLSLGVGLVLTGVTVFLELRSEREIASLRSKVNGLIHEINTLRHNLRHLNNTVVALDTRETAVEEQNNEEEYDYEDYDDPNSENYDDEEETYSDGSSSARSLAPVQSSLIQSTDSKNDTRLKRESMFNSNIFTKDIAPANYANNKLSHGTKNAEKNGGKESNTQSAFNLLLGSSSHQTEPQRSNDNFKLNSSIHRAFTHRLIQESEKVERLPKVKKKRHLKVFSSELQPADSMLRHKRGGRQEDVEEFTRPEFSTRNGGHTETVAAHYGADESKCKNIRHRHCDHNDRRYHPEKHLKDWQSSSWMNLLSASSSFEMKNGVLVVQNPGLYFIYAQILYADAHDVCGFRVYQNNLPILQCTTTTVHDASKHLHKRNSCFTGSLIQLNRGDELILKETEEDRYTVFERTKSFFGLFKVGNV